jgi:hypothetical protein
MISAGGMKVAYRGIFEEQGEWRSGISWKGTRIREKRSTKSKKTTLASGEPERETRSPCYERYLAYACRDSSCSGPEALASFNRRNNSKLREFVLEEIRG